MTTIRTDLLRQLADHLLHGKLGHEVFDFSTYNSAISGCGTAGCAIGECPILWPKEWRFDTWGEPNLKSYDYTIASGLSFFNINIEMFRHLFIGYKQKTKLFGGKDLEHTATKEQVANNMLIFCDKADNGEF